MTPLRLLAVLFAVIGVTSLQPVSSAQPASTTLEARTSDAGGVRVVVQPQTDAPVNGAWEFSVSMDTHTKPLTDDLAQVSALISDAGRRLTPLAWQGDPPGGHHRKGVLRFPYDGAPPKSVQLQIDRIGGVAERVF